MAVPAELQGWREWRLPALRLLWWAAWAEFLLVRLLSRVGIYIPKAGTALVVYRMAVAAGEAAFNLSLLAAVGMLAATLPGLWRSHPGAVLIGAAAAGMVLLAPGAAPGAGWSLAAAVLAAGAVAALGASAIKRREAEPGLRASLCVVLAVQVLGYAVTAAQLSWGILDLAGAFPAAGMLMRGGELLALLAPVALAVPVLRRLPLRTAGAIGLAGAAALGAAYWASADLTAILAMYSLGFTLSWPVWLYLIALAAGLPAVAGLIRQDPVAGLSLGLLFLAGYTLTANQQHILVLSAWAALALPAGAWQAGALRADERGEASA